MTQPDAEILVVMDIVEEPKEEGVIKKKTEEIDRGFSVNVPVRKKKNNNTIDRIGSNKEIRDGDSETVYFKRRKK